MKQLIGRHVLIVHGTNDDSTHPDLSYRLAERVKKVNRDVCRFEVHTDGHLLHDHRAEVASLTADFVLGTLLGRSFARPVADALAAPPRSACACPWPRVSDGRPNCAERGAAAAGVTPADPPFDEVGHPGEPGHLVLGQGGARTGRHGRRAQAEEQGAQEHLRALGTGDRRVHQTVPGAVVEQAVGHHDRVGVRDGPPVRREVDDRGGPADREEDVPRQVAVDELVPRVDRFAEPFHPGDQPPDLRRRHRRRLRCRLAPGEAVGHRPRMPVRVQAAGSRHIAQCLVEGPARGQQGAPSAGGTGLTHQELGRRPSFDDVTTTHGAQESRYPEVPAALQTFHQPRGPVGLRGVGARLQHRARHPDAVPLASRERLGPAGEPEGFQDMRGRQGRVGRRGHAPYRPGPAALRASAFRAGAVSRGGADRACRAGTS